MAPDAVRRAKPDAARETPQQKRAREARLRKGGRHCPVCLTVLPSLSGRPARKCPACGGGPLPERRCAKCHEAGVWASEVDAGCAACGHHGSRVRVIAGQDWLSDPGRTGRG